MKRIILGMMTILSMTLAAADSDFALTVHGIIAGADGKTPDDRNRTVTVRLYGGETSQEVLWARTYAVLLATNGLFTVEISDQEGSTPEDGKAGSCASLLQAVMAAPDLVLWAGLTDKRAYGEFKPRIRLSSVPRALRAYRARRPAQGFEVGGRLVASSITAQALDASGGVNAPVVNASSRLQVAGTLNAGSLRVDGNLTATGAVTADGTLTTGELEVSPGGTLTAETVTANKLTARECQTAGITNITVGGQDVSFPIGSIAMWSGRYDTIPAGWRICDGGDGTPDLRDRFVVGVGGSYTLNKTGGESFVTLEDRHMPEHQHLFRYRVFGYDPTHKNNDETIANMWGLQYVERMSAEAGGNQPHENRPPYYALYFIQRKQ